MQYFTGSKAHNIALRDRAIGLGFKLNEYGLSLIRLDDNNSARRRIERARGLRKCWRSTGSPGTARGRGEIEAAAARVPCRAWSSGRSSRHDLHSHTTATDGKNDIAAMAEAARNAGLEYLAITDHSKALAMANGLDEARALAHAEPPLKHDAQHGIRLLAGISHDIKPDGSLDLANDCLAALDLVVASVHSGFNQDRQQMMTGAVAGDRESARRHPRTSDRAAAAQAREPYAFDVRKRSSPQRIGTTSRSRSIAR